MIDIYSAATLNDKVMPPSSGNQLTVHTRSHLFLSVLAGLGHVIGMP